MLIEIISVCKKKETDTISGREPELRRALDEQGFTLLGIRKTLLQSAAINAALDSISKSDRKPDAVIITGALTSKDNKSFKKYFVETVVKAEKAEREPVPKDYYKKRDEAFKAAKKRKASKQELKALDEEFKLTRKKAKVFSLGEFGNGYKGYAFVYKGMKIAAVPKEELTGYNFRIMAAVAAKRIIQVYENSKNEVPDGFTEEKYTPPRTGFLNNFIPRPGDDKKEVFRKCIRILVSLALVAAVCVALYFSVFLSMQNQQLNGDIQRIAHGDNSDSGKAPDSGDTINWDELKKINKEIVGWIQIKNTKIDYPILWHKGDDEYGQYYLNHNYKGDYDSYGSVFLDYRCTEGMESKNIVLHAHHMNDGSMFGNLMEYGGTEGNLDFYKKSPTIRMDTPAANGNYKIISVFKTNTLSAHGEFFNYMKGNFQNEKDFMNYVYNVRVRSLINCPVDVNEDDELLTLSTCSYEYTNFRTVVVARRVRIGEAVKVDTSKASLNDNAVWPEVYYATRGGTRPTLTDFCTAYERKQIDWYNGDYDFKEQRVIPSTTESTTEKQTDKTAEKTKSSASATTQPTTKAVIMCKVEFINYDGSVISTQSVEYGKAAKAPKTPVKPSDEYYDYIFKGWGLDFKKVTGDMTIAPVFEPQLKPEYTNMQ